MVQTLAPTLREAHVILSNYFLRVFPFLDVKQRVLIVLLCYCTTLHLFEFNNGWHQLLFIAAWGANFHSQRQTIVVLILILHILARGVFAFLTLTYYALKATAETFVKLAGITLV